MLNGLDPILIFNISKNVSFIKTNITDKKIPVASQIIEKISLPVIPVYLSRDLTGLSIDTEDKAIEIDTQIETLQSSESFITQRGLNNTVTVQILAEKGSIGLTLLAALSDFVFPLVTAKEITMTYMHGAITVFDGLLHSFKIGQNANSTLQTITIELVRIGINKPAQVPSIPNNPGVNLLTAAKPAA